MNTHKPHDKDCLLPSKGIKQLTSKAQHAKLWKRSPIAQHRRYTIWTPHMKFTQSDRAGMLNLNGTLYHTRPVHDTQLSLRMRQSNPSHGSSTAREDWPSMATRRLRQGGRCTHLLILVGHGFGDVFLKQQPHLERPDHVIMMS